jgi:hypothetical protein
VLGLKHSLTHCVYCQSVFLVYCQSLYSWRKQSSQHEECSHGCY